MAWVFAAVQDRYARDPAFTDHEARAWQVEWLRTQQEVFARQLTEEGATEHVREAAEDLVIEREIIATLPPRVVHEVWNNWAYLEGEVTDPVDPATVRHDELSTLHWYDRVDAATVDSPEPVGNPAEYRGSGPIEDVALAPAMTWTDADKKAALEEAIRIYGIEPGQWFDVDWPPVAHLYDPGYVYQTDFVTCDAHVEDGGDDDCQDCLDSVRDVVENMAEWKWTTALRINEIRFDREGREFSAECFSEQAFEVATTHQDPREVLIGPPGQGRQW
ncbi:hypothetical protein H7J71_08445 [Mycolicibacterium peregrinum]|uniref:hypothetical protein n=1 Tax=Mycolicibacterium peregrinum TaxID=43304 RepID=UPI00105579C2|nr:hypothetical protein [Mycolicibacterium peregrinum]MCV7202044.1 hypothetical protein [Mycolicibacterium peregrinum]